MAEVETGAEVESFREKYENELAHRVLAAYLSMRMGIGMDWALKKYAKEYSEEEEGTIGTFWLQIARAIIDAMEGKTLVPDKETPSPPYHG